MDAIGLDLHKHASQICVLDAANTVTEHRIRTLRATIGDFFRARPRSRVLLEASTESEWVAQLLEELGHEVIVADPNYAPMYASLNRQVKTDRRDARVLAEAARRGTFHRAHRTSGAQRDVRARLGVRDALVRTRSRLISLARTLVRRTGARVPLGPSERFTELLAHVELPADVQAQLTPLVTVLNALQPEIAAADAVLAQRTKHDDVIRRLTGTPGVGPVTAAMFVATLDTPTRFADSHCVASYLGLVPREYSSGERRHRGAITKLGNPRLRGLLVECAWTVLRSRSADAKRLREWALNVARRRGRRVAVVALARRLATVLFAIWRDGTVYQAMRHPVGAPTLLTPTAA